MILRLTSLPPNPFQIPQLDFQLFYIQHVLPPLLFSYLKHLYQRPNLPTSLSEFPFSSVSIILTLETKRS